MYMYMFWHILPMYDCKPIFFAHEFPGENHAGPAWLRSEAEMSPAGEPFGVVLQVPGAFSTSKRVQLGSYVHDMSDLQVSHCSTCWCLAGNEGMIHNDYS